MTFWREALLERRRVVIAGGPAEPVLLEALTRLGAEIEELEPGMGDEDAVAWARSRRPLDALLYDSRALFAGGGRDPLRAATDRAWEAVRAVAVGAMIERGAPSKIVLLAPRPDAGRHAEALTSALENLARTLSVEWARYGITTTAIAPGARTTDEQVAGIVTFLLSRAGGYVSGCRFDLS